MGSRLMKVTFRELNGPSERFFIFAGKRLIALSLLIFVLALAFHIFQVSRSPRPILIGNELSHVKLVHSLVIKHSFSINPRYSDASFYEGRYYSNKPPGYAMFTAVPYYIYATVSGLHDLKHTFFFSKIWNAVLSSLTVVSLFLFLTTFNLSEGSILFGLAAAVFGTLFPAYSSLANSIPLSIFLLSISLLFLRLSRIRGDDSVLWMTSLFASAYALIVDYSNGFVLFPIMILLFVTALRQRRIIHFIICISLPLGLLAFYNYEVFDSLFVNTYSYYVKPSYVPWRGVKNSMLLENIPNGLYGLLVSPSRGLFLLSPVTLMGVIALRDFFKEENRDHRDLLLMSCMAITGIIAMSAYGLWHGGHSIGYRHIILSAVILGTLSSFCFNQLKKGTKIAALILLVFSTSTGILSFFIQLDNKFLALTWKGEPADIHANFYTELLYPFITKFF
jgi:hypothetical protein